MAIKTTISDYKILKEIGSGGMGAVYEAEHMETGDKAAVKVIHSELFKSAEFRKKFQDEGDLLSRFEHKNIVKYIEDGESEGCLYIVTELLKGESLEERFRSQEKPIKTNSVVKLLIELALGLGFAHLNGVIHRDIKPANIFLHKINGEVVPKILDLGIAKFKDESTKTAAGMALGTPQYISPEVFKGKKATPASDIYSLGIIAFRLLTGKMPFDVQRDQSNIVAISLAIHSAHEKGLPKVQEINPDVYPRLASIVDRMLQTDPQKRHSNGSELFEALIESDDADKTQFEIPNIQTVNIPKQVSVSGKKKKEKIIYAEYKDIFYQVDRAVNIEFDKQDRQTPIILLAAGLLVGLIFFIFLLVSFFLGISLVIFIVAIFYLVKKTDKGNQFFSSSTPKSIEPRTGKTIKVDKKGIAIYETSINWNCIEDFEIKRKSSRQEMLLMEIKIWYFKKDSSNIFHIDVPYDIDRHGKLSGILMQKNEQISKMVKKCPNCQSYLNSDTTYEYYCKSCNITFRKIYDDHE